MRPRLALVPGEPAGIGPELVVRAAQRAWEAELVIYGDAAVLRRAAEMLALPLFLHARDEPPRDPHSLEFVDIPHPVAVEFGKPEPANAASVVASLTRAAQACLDGELDGSGIASFSVRSADYGSKCFWVNRTDDSTEKFSIKGCIYTK